MVTNPTYQGIASARPTATETTPTPAPALTAEQTALLAGIPDQTCPEIEPSLDTIKNIGWLPNTPVAPTIGPSYHIVDACLYHNGKRVYEKSLFYAMIVGEFGSEGIAAASKAHSATRP